MEEGPRATGGWKGVRLAGKCVPFRPDATATIRMPGSNKVYLPVFDTPEEMRVIMEQLGMGDYKVVYIKDDDEFMEGLRKNNRPDLRIMLNLRIDDDLFNFHEIDPNNPLAFSEIN
jgi:hypothetical protein